MTIGPVEGELDRSGSIGAVMRPSVDSPSAVAGAPKVAGRPQLMRVLNERLLMEHIRALGRVSRVELARRTGLSKPTVALALASLEQDGLIKVAGLRTGFRGPAAVLYEIRPDVGFVLGLDVGREYLRGALADMSGSVRARSSREARSAGAKDRLAELVALADELVAIAGATHSRVTQVVIGSPGVYDPRRAALSMAANFPGWESPDVMLELQQSFKATTIVENDINVAALAERDMGHGRDARSFCVVSIGTGIGMGLVIDGHLYPGAHGAAGEIAYLPLASPDVRSSEARRHGPLEAAASASAVVRAARGVGMRGARSARQVFEAAANGDPRAEVIVEREAELVAQAVSSVVAVVDPQLVVLLGGIGQAPGFAEKVVAQLERLMPFAPEVRVSALGHEAVVDGCLVLGLERAWQRLLDRS
jgi:predicted NBD/HSP70 family sugar kinase